MGKITDTISKWLIAAVKVYKYLFSPLLGQCCRFYPSCSSYAIEAIQTLGCFYGSYLTLKRVLRCHPFAKGGIDLVPETKKCRQI